MTYDPMRIGNQRPRIEVVPAAKTTAADDVIVMARAAGMELDDWQQHVLRGALGETPDGRWAAFEAALVVPRQAGKSALLEALILAALFVWQERTVIFSAHLFATAAETFQRLQGLIEASEFADEVAKVYTANGKEAIILKNGCRVKFMARSKGGGRGFSGDRIIFDEAYDLNPKALGAMVPTLAARSMRGDSNPQIWYASSAAHDHSVVLHGLRTRAFSDDPGRLYYAEWSADESAKNNDVDAWYQANPALGIRISEDFVRDELAALESAPEEFRRERLGIPDPLPTDTVAPPKLDQERWNDTAVTTHHDVTPGDCTLAYDVHQGWTTISIQTGSLASSWGAVVDHFKGTARLPERMAYFAAKYKPTAIGLDKGNGESFGELGAIVEHFEAEGLSTDVIKPVTPEAYKAACQAIVSAVEHGTAQRPKLAGIDQLQIAGEKATERIVGGGFVFDRKSSVPLSPLVSWLIARSLLAEEKPRSKALNTRSSLRARSSSL